MIIVIFTIATLGIIGSVWLSRKYTGQVSRLLLLITGSLSLWLLLIANYGVLVSNPVPQLMAYVVLPLLSVVSIWLAIRNIATHSDDEKQKSGTE